MEVKLIKTETFYEVMKSWWDGHGFSYVSPSMLPENTFVCFNNAKIPVYSMCFYNTDSNLCWIGWQLSNPHVSKEEKKGCFSFLFDEVEKYAKEVGYHCLFTTSNTPAVEEVLQNKVFKQGDINVNHYIKIIK